MTAWAVGRTPDMTEQAESPREDDRNDELDESQAPDPEQPGDAENDPEAD